MSDKRFTGSVTVGSVGGKPMVIATEDDQVILTTPSGEAFTMTEDEAWCLARQLDLACRRVRRGS